QRSYNIGPITTYMMSCFNTTCGQYNQSRSSGFKIEGTGRELSNSKTSVRLSYPLVAILSHSSDIIMEFRDQ
ncbi:hypothetical protein L210DRAFT_3549176, partial [Boletus edulis BED1]